MSHEERARRRGLQLEPEDLAGHTIEELSDYLDAGRTPRDPSIEENAGCRIALEALERLHGLSPDLLATDVAAEERTDEGWVQRIMSRISFEARSGRRIPIASSEPRADLGITEGAVRGLIRSAEQSIDGVLIGRCRLDGDVTRVHEPVHVTVEASVPYGRAIHDLADRLRENIMVRLRSHTELNIVAVDITVRDVHDEETEER
ncbi:Asp23/Gls24 family envelope stress response protein [Microbacterium halotolerans]|uniref:Asp23/Gls24 family envelope stress response protein n=1 Tax=Microbacterium halotolerans TaxID=246613 RepID=UPI000E6AB834|nr:Asp23/Gls24 family envelope stress response protein [Microbacterium halotolerans]